MNGMSDIAKAITRIVLAPLFIFAAYIMLSATHSHGAGFAGGVIIALAVLLLLLAFGRAALGSLRAEHFEMMASAALLGLIITTILTLFFKIPVIPGLPNANSYMLLLSNVLLCLAVAASLLLVFLSLLSFDGQEEE
jgi:multicomponent Na+:H+ antiporter subunit B